MTQHLPGFEPLEAHVLGREPMPILSYWEPWLSLHIAGVKLHETRNRPTKVRGLVALHASKQLVLDLDPEVEALCEFAIGADWKAKCKAGLGCVRAVAKLTACHPTDLLAEGRPPLLLPIQESDYLSGNYADGRFGWRMDRVQALKDPLPLKGGQGWFRWTPPADLTSRLLPPVDHFEAARRWEGRHA